MIKTKEQLEHELSLLKQKDLFTYDCNYCGKEVTRNVKQTRRSLSKAEGLFCSQNCLNSFKHGEYYSKYNCLSCTKEFTRLISQVTNPERVFCGHSCSAKVTNTGRILSREVKQKIKRTVESKIKPSIEKPPEEYSKTCQVCKQQFKTFYKTYKFCSLECNKEYADRDNQKIQKSLLKDGPNCYIRFLNCKECTSAFVLTNRRHTSQFCSDTCRKSNASRKMSERLAKAENRINLGRGKPSWMESSFADWLDSFNVKYRTEVQFKNHDLGKYYYADFVFDQFSLIIELDGTHHRLTVEKDKLRDQYIKSYYNYDTLRVTYNEYKSKVKLPYIAKLLNITE